MVPAQKFYYYFRNWLYEYLNAGKNVSSSNGKNNCHMNMLINYANWLINYAC